MEEVSLFVPGRIGIIGELSDLSASYLKENKNLSPGKIIACSIDKGIYSKSRKSDKFKYVYEDLYFEVDLNENDLEMSIVNEPFFSYICGTLLYLVRKYNINFGIDLKIEKMDLPMKKGLSSSAAICLTIVKSYNMLYDLNLSNCELIEVAYQGEHLAGSFCGLLDQNSILSKNCTCFNFYSDKVVMEDVHLKKELHLLIVDLKSSKNTKYIMNCFKKALPFPKKTDDYFLHDIIGTKNLNIVTDAVNYLESGDLENFGKCLNYCQELMDKAKNVCKEFKAPNLHLLLSDGFIKNMIYGGKSMGSGGDGSLLLVAKNNMYQNILEEYIKCVYNMESITLNIKNEE